MGGKKVQVCCGQESDVKQGKCHRDEPVLR
jgi:hypothetical protein